MEKGEISNQMAPRVVFVWEGLLAQLPPDKVAKEARCIKWGRWKTAFACWQEHILMRYATHDFAWRLGQNVDVLCTHPPKFASILEKHLDASNYSYNRFYNHSLVDFERMLPHLPEVSVIYHAESRRPFLFGGKGKLIRSVGDLWAHG